MAQKRKFKGLRGLIAEVRDFRGNSTNQSYLDVRLARALEAFLDRQDAGGYEYFVMYPRVSEVEPHRGPMTEEEADTWIREFEDEGGLVGAFVKARRFVGEIEVVS